MSKIIAYKKVGKVITVRLPYVNNTPVYSFFNLQEEKENWLIKTIKQYNKFFREKDWDSIVQYCEEYVQPKNEKIIATRIERKKLEREYKQVVLQTKTILDVYKDIPGLTVHKDKVTLTGFTFSLPKLFIDTVKSWYEAGEDITPLYNFMYLLSTNPVEHVRNDLFEFIKTHKFLLTPNGYIVVFRNVNMYQPGIDAALATFVQESYVKIKLQKKSPQHFFVVQQENGTYTTTRSTNLADKVVLGTVAELYNAPTTTIYTDAYTRTFRIKIGEVVQMERNNCDASKESCSSGLHAASLQYVKSWYSHGTHTLMCLVNPANVISVPYSEGKFRCCEYYPVAEVDRDKLNEFWNSAYKVYDEDYAQVDFKQILSVLKSTDAQVDYTFLADSDSQLAKELLKEIKHLKKQNIKGEEISHLTDNEVVNILNNRIQLVNVCM